jgi:hypothetical protein
MLCIFCDEFEGYCEGDSTMHLLFSDIYIYVYVNVNVNVYVDVFLTRHILIVFLCNMLRGSTFLTLSLLLRIFIVKHGKFFYIFVGKMRCLCLECRERNSIIRPGIRLQRQKLAANIFYQSPQKSFGFKHGKGRLGHLVDAVMRPNSLYFPFSGSAVSGYTTEKNLFDPHDLFLLESLGR